MLFAKTKSPWTILIGSSDVCGHWSCTVVVKYAYAPLWAVGFILENLKMIMINIFNLPLFLRSFKILAEKYQNNHLKLSSGDIILFDYSIKNISTQDYSQMTPDRKNWNILLTRTESNKPDNLAKNCTVSSFKISPCNLLFCSLSLLHQR